MATDWRLEAGCRDYPTEWWFQQKGEKHLSDRARAICEGCPVQQQCLEYSLTFGERELHGIWGGTSQNQRRYILRRRNIAA